MRLPILILFLCCSGLFARAQIKIVPRKSLEEVINPQLSDDSSFLQFDYMFIEAEPMSESSGIQTFVYPFRNVGKSRIEIRRLVSTCSCAVASYMKQDILPGETGEIIVRYNPKGHPGRFERKVYVYTGEYEVPTAVLRLSVNVERGTDLSGLYPVPMGNIRLRRAQVGFYKGRRGAERCVFVNVSDKPLSVRCEKALLPSCLEVHAEPQPVPSGQEGEIVVTYDPTKGGERDEIPVVIKGTGLPPIQSTLLVTFE